MASEMPYIKSSIKCNNKDFVIRFCRRILPDHQLNQIIRILSTGIWLYIPSSTEAVIPGTASISRNYFLKVLINDFSRHLRAAFNSSLSILFSNEMKKELWPR